MFKYIFWYLYFFLINMSHFEIVLDNKNKYKIKLENDSYLSEARKLIKKKINQENNLLSSRHKF